MKTTPTTLKLDETLKLKLKSEAKKENRTLHGYLIHILKKHIETINQPKN